MLPITVTGFEWVLSTCLLLSALGVVCFKQPVYSSLSFLASLLALAGLYLQLSAEFTATIQVLIYAGAILVIFMFVIVLFQDAHYQLEKFAKNSSSLLLATASVAFLFMVAWMIIGIAEQSSTEKGVTDEFGTVQSLGHSLYVEFFFPFEAITLLFLIAVVGALYIAKREPHSHQNSIG